MILLSYTSSSICSGVQTKRERLLSRHEGGGVERNREENGKNNGESLGRLLSELSSLSSSFDKPNDDDDQYG